MLIVGLLCSSAYGKTIYVDDDAMGANDGTSWENAYNFLQDALADANSAPKPVEIRAAQGVYTPDSNSAMPDGTGDREATFHLINGVTLRGGYAGVAESDPDARDVAAYETILSGDLKGDDVEQEKPTRAENGYHVVTGSSTDQTAVLDGFTITGGHADGPTSGDEWPWKHRLQCGSGMYNSEGSPTLTNCTFSSNTADFDGGGMYNDFNSSPTLTNCKFSGNSAGGGGGMYNEESSPTLTNCTFSGNSAGWHGGGMSNDQSSPTLTNCKFSGNSAEGESDEPAPGGGMFNRDSSSPVLTSCTFNGNSAQWGGGMSNSNSSPMLTNCTFSGNSANCGGGMSNGQSNPKVTNCTFTGNSADDSGGGMFNWDNCSPTVTNCTFNGNSAQWGGGMSNGEYSNPTLDNCTFSGNSANGGGGMSNGQSNPKVTNCTFTGNSADGSGGGMHNWDNCSPTVTNCTFNGNLAQRGGGMSNGDHCGPAVTNCILWGNTASSGAQIYNDGTSSATVSYSDVQGGWLGQGNIDTDPLFVDPAGPDYIPGTEDDDLRLSLVSPCVDAGDPDYMPQADETDLGGDPRLRYERVDMGAYEFQGTIYVDDDAPEDPGPGDMIVSDPLENGTEPHPMDSIQEAIDVAKDGYTVLVRAGLYLEAYTDDSIDFLGKDITLRSTDPTDWDVVGSTVIRGGVQFSGAEDPTCTLTGLTIRDRYYGAVYGNHTRATISHCIISGNGPCGATVLKDCDGTISNCLITDNTTFFHCGVYPVIFGCNGLIKNCTIANNVSGISVGDATIENCIIYNNAGPQISVAPGASVSISYSDVQGGLEGIAGDGSVLWGLGNIDTDPYFVRSGYWVEEPLQLIDGDYHLKSEGWRWNTEGKSWTYDYVSSRCMDAGNPGSPLRDEVMSVPRDPDNAWGMNLRTNMGAYGGTSQASVPPHGWALLADLNNDWVTDIADLAHLAEDWLTVAAEQPGDLNRDGVVDMKDFSYLAGDWLKPAGWLNSE